MIGELPKTLDVCGGEFEIRSDFRVALAIFKAYDDPNLSPAEKSAVCLQCLYKTVPNDVEAAREAANWFLDGGSTVKLKALPVRTVDWEQDEGMLFPAVNKAAGKEVRGGGYMHWWTFLGYFGEMGECLYSQVLNIRQKRAKGKGSKSGSRSFFAPIRN